MIYLQCLCHFELLCTQQSNTLINLIHLNFLSKSHMYVYYICRVCLVQLSSQIHYQNSEISIKGVQKKNRFLQTWRFLKFILKSARTPDLPDSRKTKLEKYYPYAIGYVLNHFFVLFPIGTPISNRSSSRTYAVHGVLQAAATVLPSVQRESSAPPHTRRRAISSPPRSA
jgi:hypothetical protein